MVETVTYELLETLGTVEVRVYPACIVATTSLPLKDRSAAFRRIAGYIFGGNSRKQSIAMTAPVLMHASDESFHMSFILPRAYKFSELPKPLDATVTLKQVPPRRLAVLTFSGSLSDGAIERHTRTLLSTIVANDQVITGEPFAMGYNGPWTLPFLRRNEVAVELVGLGTASQRAKRRK